MIGICIELKSTCKHCSSPIMLNAFTEKILCPSCNKYNNFSQENWHSLLDDAVKEAPDFKPGEGQPSTIMQGEFTYHLTYGRQDPRCRDCKTQLDITKLEEYSKAGHAVCTKCSKEVYVRKPNDFVKESFPQVLFLAAEDEEQMVVNPYP